MKLYEIDAAIESLVYQMVDEETGEILENDEIRSQIDSLQMERQSKLEYIAKLALNARAEAEAYKSEEKRLAERRKRSEKTHDRLVSLLDYYCAGEKTQLGVATVSYRKSDKLVIDDEFKAIDALINSKHVQLLTVNNPEIDKVGVKKLIKSGMTLQGMHIEQTISCSLK